MELPLTPIDFLLRARRLFPDREGVIQHEGGERSLGSSPTPTWPSAPLAWRRCCRTTSTFGPATGSRGSAAIATSCSRPTTACFSPARCCSRSTSASRRPSCAASSTTAAPRCSSATRRSPRSTTRCVQVTLGDEYESRLAAQPQLVDRPARASTSAPSPRSSTRAGRRASRRGRCSPTAGCTSTRSTPR